MCGSVCHSLAVLRSAAAFVPSYRLKWELSAASSKNLRILLNALCTTLSACIIIRAAITSHRRRLQVDHFHLQVDHFHHRRLYLDHLEATINRL